MDTLLDRFCRYVKVETTAAEEAKTYPSTPGQLDLGRMLADELRALKLDDVSMDENGIVMATVPGNSPGTTDNRVVFAHGPAGVYGQENVKPVIHRNYDGKDITLPGDSSRIIKVSETDGLAALKGKTLITSDGTTLLGADDKAGLAVIMTAAAHSWTHPEIEARADPHHFYLRRGGRDMVRSKLDLKKIGGEVSPTRSTARRRHRSKMKLWSANLAVVTITGKNVHSRASPRGGWSTRIRLGGGVHRANAVADARTRDDGRRRCGFASVRHRRRRCRRRSFVFCCGSFVTKGTWQIE